MKCIRPALPVLMLCAMVLALVSPAQLLAQDTGTAELGLGEVEALQLAELMRMFGNDSPKLEALSLVLQVSPDETSATLRTALGQVTTAIEQSGLATDFAAPPQPTGDALFDAYALAVDEQLNALTVEQIAAVTKAAAVPDELLAEWEPVFGADPRYWELRYFSLICTLDEQRSLITTTSPLSCSDAGLAIHRRAAEFLHEARQRGCARSNTLLLLYHELRIDHFAQLAGLSDYDVATEFNSDYAVDFELTIRPEFSPEELAQSRALQAEFEAAELAVLDEAVTLGAVEAWPYYFRGIHYFELGEHELAVRDLNSGNQAWVNSYPRPFPLDVYSRACQTGEPAGSAVVTGAIGLANYHLPDSQLLKRHCKEALLMFDLGAGPELIEAWHQFACRYSACWPETRILPLNVLVMLGIFRNHFYDSYLAELSPAQVETLDRMVGAQEAFKQLTFQDEESYEPVGALMVLSLAGEARGAALSCYLMNMHEAQHLAANIFPIIDDLARVHYPELATPSALRKYPRLTTAQLARDRRFQRSIDSTHGIFSQAATAFRVRR